MVNLPGEIVGVDQPELNGVHQRLPRSFDDIAIDTNGGPDPVTVGGINEDANDCTRGCAAIDDTNLEIGEVDALKSREPTVERKTHGSVERTGPAKQAMRVGACGARTTIEVFSIGTAHSGATMFQYSSS